MIEVGIIALCLLLNALLAAFEMAFVSVSRGELRRQASSGTAEAAWILARRDHPERTLSVVQIGITVVSAVAATVGGMEAADRIAPLVIERLGVSLGSAKVLAVLAIVVPLTYFSVVFGELLPKSLALRNATFIALKGAHIVAGAERALAPVVWVLESSIRLLLKAVGRGSRPSETIEKTVDVEGLAPAHREYVLNLAYIEQKTVRDFLLPWKSVIFVHSSDTLEEVTRVVFTSGHTRLPVVGDDEGIAGFLHTKEFLALRETGEQNWLTILRPVLKVGEGDSAIRVLRLMQERRSHMAVVYTSEGRRSGIVTLEDIIEEVVGDLADEDDDGRARRIFTSKARSRRVA